MLVTGPGIAPNTTITVTPGVYDRVTLSNPATSVASPTRVSIAASPSGATYDPSINLVTITTTAPHGFTPGQWVTIDGVGNAAYNGTFKVYDTPTTTTFRYITPNITPTSPAAASGGGTALQPYSFVGGPSSYVVQTLINNWYMWADYYVKYVNAPTGPTVTNVPGSINAIKAPTDGEDENAVILTLPNGTTDVRVGDVVTGSGIVPIVNRQYPANQVNQNVSPNTTVAAILDRTHVRLSNPVLTKVTDGTYSFSPPVAIPRSLTDTPAYNSAQAVGLSFSTGTAEQKKVALDFARSVYDVMQGWSHLTEPSYLSQSALLLNYVIGGNIGTFVLQDPGKNTGVALPVLRLNQLRDELKSVLRGVDNFGDVQESTGLWYPDPA